MHLKQEIASFNSALGLRYDLQVICNSFYDLEELRWQSHIFMFTLNMFF